MTERWIQWQREHWAALEVLQQAERAYHRTVAGSAFADPAGDASLEARRKALLEQIDASRGKLDEIRARQPEN